MGTMGTEKCEYACAIWVKIARSQEGVTQCFIC